MTEPTSIVSVKPVVLPAPGRGEDLRVKVSAPATGRDLPVVVFSHGYGSSMDAYGPLAEHWAAHGFVVVQPTHLDSRTLGLAPDDPRTPRIWRFRVADVRRVLDHLDVLEAAVPGLGGRVDRDRVAVAGHSFGGQTAGSLLGLRVLGPDGEEGADLADPRVRAGVLLATAGEGGADLTAFAAEHYPFMNASFAGMATPALVVAGDRDDSPLSVRGPDWMTDPYFRGPGGKSLLTLFGAEHSLGGIPGYEAAETTDEHPGRVALVQRATVAYLRAALGLDPAGWPRVQAELAESADPLGRIESR
jgi:predicted dienelactone hydrolase